MSTIDISIRGTGLHRSINVDMMRDRLNLIRDRLTAEIEANPEREVGLSARLDKITAQIDRLDRFADRDIEISPKRAMKELENGMRLISEGSRYLNRNYSDGSRSGEQWKLNQWFNNLRSAYDKIDTYG